MNQMVLNQSKGYAMDWKNETPQGKKLFLANLRHAVATWDAGVDRQAVQNAIKMIERKAA